jgi:hypothetical protein
MLDRTRWYGLVWWVIKVPLCLRRRQRCGGTGCDVITPLSGYYGFGGPPPPCPLLPLPVHRDDGPTAVVAASSSVLVSYCTPPSLLCALRYSGNQAIADCGANICHYICADLLAICCMYPGNQATMLSLDIFRWIDCVMSRFFISNLLHVSRVLCWSPYIHLVIGEVIKLYLLIKWISSYFTVPEICT